MLTGIDRHEVKEFVSSKDKGQENPTKFLIGNISNREKIRLTKALKKCMGDDGKTIDVTKIEDDELFRIFRLGVRQVKNITIEGKTQDIQEFPDELLDYAVDIEVLMEVVAEVLMANFPGEIERKN